MAPLYSFAGKDQVHHGSSVCRWLYSLCFLTSILLRPGASVAVERNNWAVLVETSKYWYNYRHVANVLSFYHTIKRLGIPDSQILLMLAEDIACSPRNARPGTVFNEMHHQINLYGEEVEVDYRGDEVSVENFLRLLTGRHPPNTPRNKRLLTDSMSNIFIFITGHSGEEFIKFQDWEEITSKDIADAFAQMHQQRRYRQIFWMSDTCQAATLQNQFYSPGILAYGSSGKKENSYSHHVDSELGIAVVDRFTYYALEFFNRLTTTSADTVQTFTRWFDPQALLATPELRSDLFGQRPEDTRLTEFLASTGRMRFQSSLIELAVDPVITSSGADHVLAELGNLRSTIGGRDPGLSAAVRDAWLDPTISSGLPKLLEELQRISFGGAPRSETPVFLTYQDIVQEKAAAWLFAFVALAMVGGLLL